MNHRIVKINHRLIQRRLRLVDLRPVHLVLSHGGIVSSLSRVHFALRDQFPLHQFFVSLQGPLRVLDGHFRLCDVGLSCEEVGTRLIDCGLEFVLIQLRDHLVLFHFAVEVDKKLVDSSGDLTADLNRDDSLQCPGRGHYLGNVLSLCRHGDIRRLLGASSKSPKAIPRAHEYK